MYSEKVKVDILIDFKSTHTYRSVVKNIKVRVGLNDCSQVDVVYQTKLIATHS